MRSVNEAINRLERTGSIYRKKGSGRPYSATGDENVNDEMMEMMESQENAPGTHHSQRECANLLDISQTSVRRVAKRKGLNNFKRVTTPQLEEGAVQRRLGRSRDLRKRFPTWKVKQLVFQDEKDFPIQVPVNRQNNRVYGKGKKSEISSSRLYHRKNKFSKKLMVSACVSWNGTTKPFFVDPAK